MPLDPPIDSRFALAQLGELDMETIRHWADRLPGVGKWSSFAAIGYTSPFADFSATDRPVRIRREFADIVRVEGLMKSTGNVNNLAVVITLPVQFRPARLQEVPMMSASAAVSCGVNFEIDTTGAMYTTEIVGVAYPQTFGYIRVGFTYTLSADK